MRALLLVLVVLLSFSLGWIISSQKNTVDIDAVSASVEDQIRRVAKFASAEARYSRLIKYEDLGSTEWFPGTDKRVILQANIRVLFGFALDSVRVNVDRSTKTLIVNGWPAPEALSTAFETEFFDIEEGLFVEIDSKDLNEISAIARKELENEIDYAQLERESYQEASELLDLIRSELEASGWSFRVVGWPDHVIE